MALGGFDRRVAAGGEDAGPVVEALFGVDDGFDVNGALRGGLGGVGEGNLPVVLGRARQPVRAFQVSMNSYMLPNRWRFSKSATSGASPLRRAIAASSVGRAAPSRWT